MTDDPQLIGLPKPPAVGASALLMQRGRAAVVEFPAAEELVEEEAA